MTEIIEPRETITPEELEARYGAAQSFLVVAFQALLQQGTPEMESIIRSMCHAGVIKVESNPNDLRERKIKPKLVRLSKPQIPEACVNPGIHHFED